MNPEIVVGILSLAGTFVGTLSGIMTSNKLTGYRISQLEQKVEKHNNLIDRMYKVENRVSIIEDEMRDIKQ